VGVVGVAAAVAAAVVDVGVDVNVVVVVVVVVIVVVVVDVTESVITTGDAVVERGSLSGAADAPQPGVFGQA
jgi:hypothetical protein